MTRSPRKPRTIPDVVASHLCSGCGACAFVQPEAITMVDDVRLGRRPLVAIGAETDAAFECCPGVHLAHADLPVAGAAIGPDGPWGTVVELWEGYATDPEVRRMASSGGAATALALYAMEAEGMHGTLHIAARADQPLLNRTVLSRSRADLLAATGSRYAPASPADGLGLVEAAPAPCVFIGKPCDVAAVAKVRSRRSALDQRIGLTIAMFCAGTPSTAGTLEMLQAMGVRRIDDVVNVRYRGNGWPGDATVTLRDGSERQLTYDESWGAILQRHRPWRCHVCADHTGEFADIAVGDPWYRERDGNDPGRSLILARTSLGRDLLHRAIAAGALQLEPVAPGTLEASQPNLLRTRGAVWGRIQASRLVGIAAPSYERMPMILTWRSLGPRMQAQSVLGTIRRIATRRLRQAAVVHALDEHRLNELLPGSTTPANGPVSVVIPAWNEEALIGRTLSGLLRGAEADELEVVVVCNGCTDGTANAARRFEPRVRVIEVATAGKIQAMRAGDREVGSFPRLYLDADVEIDIDTVRALGAVLRRGDVEAAAPSVSVDVSRSSWPVRAYTRVWEALPAVESGLAGRGAYAVSEAGRSRLGDLPDVVNDDGYADRLLRGRSTTLAGHHTVVRAPANLDALVRRRVRVQVGNCQLAGESAGGDRTSGSDLVRLVMARPNLLPALPVFVFVTLAARRRARTLVRRGDQPDWGVDLTSREQAS